jgi:hypothetical protein
MLVAQGLDPTVFPQFPRLAANLAGMEGLVLGGFDALTNERLPDSPVHRTRLPVTGSDDMYGTLVNLQTGPRVLDQTLTVFEQKTPSEQSAASSASVPFDQRTASNFKSSSFMWWRRRNRIRVESAVHSKPPAGGCEPKSM